MSKKETHEMPNMVNPFNDLLNMVNNDTYKQYTNQWLDAVDNYNSQMINFQKMMIERTGQAFDEAYKMAREGLDRSVQMIDMIHSVGNAQWKQFRQQFN